MIFRHPRNHDRIHVNKLFLHVLAFVIFLSMLLGMRWLWLETYAPPEDQPEAFNGILDLRGWDLMGSKPINLNGDWAFYADTLAKEQGRSKSEKFSYMHVPGDWKDGVGDETKSSFGIGTYRLRIWLDRPITAPISLWIRNIQSAFTVDINGTTLASVGRTGEPGQASYKPSRSATIVDYIPDPGVRELDIVIRVANYEHPYLGGIVKPIKLGSHLAIQNEYGDSVDFQLIMVVVLMLHGLYAFILYLFNPRQRSFLDIFLLFVSAALTIVTSNNKLLLQWFPINYEWDLKITILSYSLLSYFIWKLSRTITFTKGKVWFAAFSTLLIIYTVVNLVAPVTWAHFLVEYRVFSVFYLFPIFMSLFLFIRMVLASREGSIFLLLSASGVLMSSIWGAIGRYWELPAVYYPVDVLAAIIGFSAYWFKRYFRNVRKISKLNDKLKLADQMKDRFLANTSHELRTPLHGILNLAISLAERENDKLSKQSIEDLNLLITVSGRMSYLLDDLLDATRLQEGRIQLQPTDIPLITVVHGVFDILKFMTEGTSVQMKVDIPDSLPHVQADEKRLVQILLNLVHNAIKYTEKGSITVSAFPDGSSMMITVKDTGIGMDQETMKRAFLPYEQGNQGINNAQGIGLGLSISKELVELHGGKLFVTSEQGGKGTTFAFTLPLSHTDAESSRKIPVSLVGNDAHKEIAVSGEFVKGLAPTKIQPGSLAQEHSVSVLAVDDDPVNLRILAGILSTESFNLKCVNSPAEALELLRSQPWDLLIADVMMPEISGYELTRTVRERYNASELPILLLTARSDAADVYASFQSGANDYVTKPVDPVELRYRIRSLITLKQTVDYRLRTEAAYMQAQIQPHFLFNTMNSIMALSDIDIDRMQSLIESFSSYLRISFSYQNRDRLVPLQQEFELLQAYLHIEQERYGERLEVVWEVDRGIDDVRIPPLTIQPLLENAVRHGVVTTIKGGTVRIKIARQENFIFIELSDNGLGMDAEKVAQLLDPPNQRNGGIGLYNTNRRLLQTFGSGLVIKSIKNQGTTVSFKVPADS